jgi:hypothetical protein
MTKHGRAEDGGENAAFRHAAEGRLERKAQDVADTVAHHVAQNQATIAG